MTRGQRGPLEMAAGLAARRDPAARGGPGLAVAKRRGQAWMGELILAIRLTMSFVPTSSQSRKTD